MGAENDGFSDIPSTGDPVVDAALQRLRERDDDRFQDLIDAVRIMMDLANRRESGLA